MIRYIKGELITKKQDYIIVENQWIGYEIYVPYSVLSQLPSAGEQVKIYTELYVREDILRLYGFMRDEDVEMFRYLISVSGIGPKGALGILSTMTPDELRYAILTEDVTAISKAKGIGKKTASKLILDLKDKVKAIALTVDIKTPLDEHIDQGHIEEAVLGLTGLGYSQKEALEAVKKAQDKTSTSSIIKEALYYLAKE